MSKDAFIFFISNEYKPDPHIIYKPDGGIVTVYWIVDDNRRKPNSK